MIINGIDLGPPIPVRTVFIQPVAFRHFPLPKIRMGYRATKRFLMFFEPTANTWTVVNVHGLSSHYVTGPGDALAMAQELEAMTVDWNTIGRASKLPPEVREAMEKYRPVRWEETD